MLFYLDEKNDIIYTRKTENDEWVYFGEKYQFIPIDDEHFLIKEFNFSTNEYENTKEPDFQLYGQAVPLENGILYAPHGLDMPVIIPKKKEENVDIKKVYEKQQDTSNFLEKFKIDLLDQQLTIFEELSTLIG